ncbi:MAG: dehydrogenase E1 component subunit alpha/beta [Caldilineaceae bacterium]|nr:dehydrogenase E1 component subunit alpha/beta [Caldilineaceae bacterium]MBP8123059.1 dehydrogenase E1 component subunit alpha/beta [Caldilineaceae bacterium]MBP9073402.1 dehydrogenase E1 component subunit alpha/beta [Caldilineaceae bacterium]
MQELSKDQLLSLYRTMLTIRRTEELLVKFYATGKLYGGVHTYIGEEAVASGVCAHLRDDDTVFSTHRGHGHALAKGMSPRELIAEVMGRATGCSGGRGGSMHLFKPEIGFMGSSGIVGPCITLAAGGGYSAMLLKTDRVSVAFFGDGGSNNGAFHEGINLATAWKLPTIFVCENNLYATEVPIGKATGNPDIASRAVAYGLPGIAVDGNDALAVYQAADEAVRRARSGGGPTLIECRTYRTRSHAEGMRDGGYRTSEEITSWKERDPIKLFHAKLLSDGHATETSLATIDAEIKELVEEAGKFAESSPLPEAASVSSHVYSANAESAGPAIQLPGAGSRELTFVDAAREALAEEMARDDTIFVVGEGIGERGGNFNTTLGLYDLYGEERLRDSPISERGFTNLCTGAAATGTRPVVDFMFIDFVTDAFGDMFNQMSKLQWMSSGRIKMPIVVRGCVGVAQSNAAHHSGNYYPFFMHIPGFRVVMPSTPADAKGLMKTALCSNDPVLFLEHKNLLAIKGPVPDGDYMIPFGQAVVRRTGTDLTMVGIGFTVNQALDAAEQLAQEGISAEVIDPRTLAPLDMDTILASVHKTGRLLVVDEDFAPCGVGAEIATQVMEHGFDDLDAPVRRLNGLFAPAPYSPSLYEPMVPSVKIIIQAVRDLLAE